MGTNTRISWARNTWNPVDGCQKASDGCKRCYAEKIMKRFPARYPGGFNTIRLHSDRLDQPLKWKQGDFVFVPSMGDLFHRDVPVEFIRRVFQTMSEATQHQFLVLTKRPERAAQLTSLEWAPNVWAGTTVENEKYYDRIKSLKKIKASHRFLSLEPLLGPLPKLKKHLKGIDWMIVGGESGAGCRLMELEWARQIRGICKKSGVLFHFKQVGGFPCKRQGLKDIPADLRIREFPEI